MKTLQEIMDEQRQQSDIHTKSNRAINASIRYEVYNHDEEWKKAVAEKLSKANKGITFSEEARLKMSEAAKRRGNNQLGLIRDQTTRDKISAKKMELSAEQRAEQARLGGLANKGKPKPKFECVHCKMMVAGNMLHRYHNDNCKKKP